MAQVEFGYLDAQGAKQSVIVSPSDRVSGTTLRDLVVSAYQQTGRNALWVEATPQALATAISTRLGIPVGRPADWNPQSDPFSAFRSRLQPGQPDPSLG